MTIIQDESRVTLCGGCFEYHDYMIDCADNDRTEFADAIESERRFTEPAAQAAVTAPAMIVTDFMQFSVDTMRGWSDAEIHDIMADRDWSRDWPLMNALAAELIRRGFLAATGKA